MAMGIYHTWNDQTFTGIDDIIDIFMILCWPNITDLIVFDHNITMPIFMITFIHGQDPTIF